jgi:NAD(P)-dependent dehydrogenase (short-subunit alcohol dehydrogenase family)
MPPLRDKVVLVTGASSGIGRGTALRLASLGARLVLAARSQENLQTVAAETKQLGAETLVVPTDVTEAEQCRHAVEAAVERFGQLDVLLCSAGLSMRGDFADSDLAAMERVIRVNFFGTLYCTHFALPHVKRSRGSLVALSSMTGLRGTPTYALYGATKFAVQGLYEALRLELRRDGVHVGVVSPGYVDTPIRHAVLGPDGTPWREPPPMPFRIWPVEKCVDKIIRLIVKRRKQALMRWFVGPLLNLDRVLGSRIGDRILDRYFPPLPGPQTERGRQLSGEPQSPES